ncbi:MAG TPA: hypothetical protein DCZ75_19685 [Geobacter sp.]|nr:hypothetical protein [Geobacter sp.]
MRRIIMMTAVGLVLISTAASAESIAGRFGITGKAGVLAPLRNHFISSDTISSTSEGKESFAGGGGFIYGIGDHTALEIEALRVPNMDVELAGSKVYEASLTDLSVGLQYRFAPDSRLVPLIGAGADFIKGELSSTTGASYSMDWTVGGHVNAGADWFITRGIAFSIDLRGIYTTRGTIKAGDTKVGRYDPLSIVGTLGFRLFLPESAYR